MGSSTKEIDVRGLAVVVRRRWLAIAAGGVLAGTLAGIAGSTTPGRYVSEGMLALPTADAPADEVTQRSTAEDVMMSRSLLMRVVSSLDLGGKQALDPPRRAPFELGRMFSAWSRAPASVSVESADRRAVDYLRSHLKVTGTDTSAVLSIVVATGSADLSASIVNEVMRQYLTQDLAAKRAVVDRSDQWLRDRASIAKLDADEAERQVRAFRSNHDVLALQAGSLSGLAFSAEQSRLAAAKQDLLRAEVSASAVAGVSASDGSMAHAAQASPTATLLRQREADLLQQQAAALLLGPRNPKRVALDEQLASVRTELGVEARKEAGSSRREVAIDQRAVSDLESSVSRAQIAASGSDDAQLLLAQLTEAAEAKNAEYRAILARRQDVEYSAGQIASGRVVSPAVAPQEPIASKISMLTLLGVVSGCLLTASVLIIRQIVWPRLLTPTDLARSVDALCLGSLPRIRRGRAGALLDSLVKDGSSAFAESLRGVRLKLQSAAAADACACTLVTSAELGEGKSTFSAALALRSAADGLRVLLIEADLHRPRLRRLLSLEPASGLEAVLVDRAPVRTSICVDPKSGLHCLLARGSVGNPVSLLAGAGFAQTISYAREHYDMVIIDGPPVLRVADPVLLSRWSDVVLFTVRAEHTEAACLAEATRRFPLAQTRLATVLTHARTRRRDRLGYYAGYREEQPKQGLLRLSPRLG